jgi:hypothetical protein
MTAAAAPAASAAVAATSAAGTATFTLRTRFVYDQSAAQKILAVQRFDGFVRLGVVANFGKTETAWLSRETIAQKRK